MTRTRTDPGVLRIDTPMAPPQWALMERTLLHAQAEACEAFFAHYFDERGYLQCVPRWGGNDGPDDAAENLLNWPMLHALGAPSAVLELYRRGWEGHLRQYTEAKTLQVPFAREGMYFREFPVMFDWFHHGESLSSFVLQGLCDPEDTVYRSRVERYAGFYMGQDPLAANYDSQRRLIRSLFNGSRGPLLRQATALDWAGDPIEVEGRFQAQHGERNYAQMLEHFQDYTDVLGDHPLNLGATTLAYIACALTGEQQYRQWLLDYVDAWVARTEANGGLIPTNVGLDGAIGGACGGKWYGGVYGWGFSVVDPVTGQVAHRPSFLDRCHYGFANALLLTGEARYLEVWRHMLQVVNSHRIEHKGQTLYPRMYGDEGWYAHEPEPFRPGALELYYWSMHPADRDLVADDAWVAFLEGKDPDYPTKALRADFAALRARMQAVRDDSTTPDTRLSDDPNELNPAMTENLTRLMLGGLPTGRAGYPLHCRLRYFDPARQRAGIPEDVAALVEQLGADSATVTLVNVSQLTPRTVILQGGAYAEHQFLSVGLGDQTHPVNASHVVMRLEPGAGARLAIRMQRYANQPTLAFPWG